jgi:hypothetical protein
VSIGELKDACKDKIDLNLYFNKNFSHLPSELGEVSRLREVDVRGCPTLMFLPRTMSKLEHALAIIGDDTSM